MMRLRLATLTAVLATTAFGAAPALAEPGHARSIVVSTPMMPMLLEYAGCVLAGQHDGAQQAVAACAPLRKKIEAKSGPVLALWHPVNTSAARRWFASALDSVDWQVEEVASGHRYVPALVLRYIGCVGDRLANDPDYTSGIVVDFASADKACVPAVNPAEAPGLTPAERNRAYYYYHAVRVGGRYLPPIPQGHPTPTFRLDGGILGPVNLMAADGSEPGTPSNS